MLKLELMTFYGFCDLLKATNDEHSFSYEVKYEIFPSPLDYLTSSLNDFEPPIRLPVYYSALPYGDGGIKKKEPTTPLSV